MLAFQEQPLLGRAPSEELPAINLSRSMLRMVLRVSRLQNYPLDSLRLPSAGHQRKLERGSIRMLVVCADRLCA